MTHSIGQTRYALQLWVEGGWWVSGKLACVLEGVIVVVGHERKKIREDPRRSGGRYSQL